MSSPAIAFANTILPPLEEDKYTSRCRIPKHLMVNANIQLGDVVEVTYKLGEEQKTTICAAWPLMDGDINSIRLDPTVILNRETEKGSDTLPVNEDGTYGVAIKVCSQPIRAQRIELMLEGKNRNLSNYQKRQIRDYLLHYTLKEKCSIGNEDAALKIVSTVPEGVAVNVTSRTEIVFIEETSPQSTTGQRTSSGNLVVGGLENAMNSLRELIKLPFLCPQAFQHLQVECPKGILIKGPPGVGKTLLVRAVANECGATLLIINGAEVYGPYIGDSEAKLRSVFEDAANEQEKGPTIIFIDEIDVLCPKRSDHNSHESRVVAQLLTLMDGLVSRGNIMVVAATNLPNVLDPALRRAGRFDREIDIPVPDALERSRILQSLCKQLPLDSQVNFDEVASVTPGYVGADIAALCREAAMASIRRTRVSNGSITATVTMNDFMQAAKRINPSTQRGSSSISVEQVAWEDIGGLHDTKKQLRQAVEWPLKYRDSFRRFQIPPPRGILLYGPSGCSKTSLVKAVATSTQANFLSVNGAAIYSPFVGDAESTIRDLFRKARMGSPSIIFFDEIDAIVGKRSFNSTSQGVQERVLATLLNEMDGVEQSADVMVIAATNRPDMLDPALLRPGRIDKTIAVSKPNEEDRLEIFQIHTKKMPLGDDVNLSILASQTTNLSGADIANMCREAALCALRENLTIETVCSRHFAIAKKNIRPHSDQAFPFVDPFLVH